MLYFPQTRIEFSNDRPVAAGVAIPAEGVALVNTLVGGTFGVKPSTGTTGEVFAGVSLSQPISIISAPKVEVQVAANGAILLAFAPLAGTVSVVNTATNVALTPGTVDATHFAVDGTNTRQINLDASNNGNTYSIAYRYSPTLAQQLSLQGNTMPGGPAGAYLGTIGVITRGDVYTSEFDTSGNWATAVGVTIGANGAFVPQSVAANCIRGVQIIELPSSSRAFLGLNINAAV